MAAKIKEKVKEKFEENRTVFGIGILNLKENCKLTKKNLEVTR